MSLCQWSDSNNILAMQHRVCGPSSRRRRSSHSLNPPPLPILEPTTTLLAQTRLRQITPVGIRIVDCNLLPSFNAPADKNNSLRSHPYETLELGVRTTGVIDKTSVVAFATLIDLVALFGFGLHDVHAFETLCDEACEFADGYAAFEWLGDGSQQTRTQRSIQFWSTYTTCHETVIASIFCAENLDRRHW